MPGYTEFAAAQQASRQTRVEAFRGTWKSLTEFAVNDGARDVVFDTKSKSILPGKPPAVGPQPLPVQQPARGRQFSKLTAPDGKTVAEYASGNLSLTIDGKTVAVTTDGDLAKRIKYGTGSWVYGEELEQRYAFGFSPDSKLPWYYRFDESPIEDYHLALGQGAQQTSLYTEAYPKPGKKNPIVDLFVCDVATNKSVKVAVRVGEFDNKIGHYVYGIKFSADSSNLIFHRMNRQQNERELCAADPRTGAIRVLDREANPAGWVEYGPLSDMRGARRGGGANDGFPEQILVNSDDDGFYNLYWLDLKAGKRQRVTSLKADVTRVVNVDDAKKLVWYMAGDGETPYRQQLHRVKFDGSGDQRLTDPKFHHTIDLNEDGSAFADKFETAGTPPELQVCDGSGKILGQVAKSKMTMEGANGFLPAQSYKFKSFDGKWDLWGQIHKPRNFDPSKKYPVLLSVYGGPLPGFSGPNDTFEMSQVTASTGFLIVEISGRGTSGRGRDFRQGIYRKMGIIEMDDQAAGIDALKQFPWADTGRVGVFGTSYGGYSSAMLLLRYPNLFHAAAASSAVTQWTNYDTTYTERYMDLLENNKEGYEAGSCMKYASQLKGWLMIYYGTADDNVHPSNAMQLIQALQRAGKSFEVQLGVDQGHTGVNFARMMEFFVERLVIDGPKK